MIILQNVTLGFRLNCCHHDHTPDCARRLYIRVVGGVGLLRQAESRQKVVLGSERLHRDNQDDVELN